MIHVYKRGRRKAQIAVDVGLSDSPELNPEERLNADLKHVIGRKIPIRTKAKLRAAAQDHMQIVAREPARVKAYFVVPEQLAKPLCRGAFS